MYNVSTNYKTYIKKPSRSFQSRIIIGERTFTNDSVIQIVPEIAQPSNTGFTIGNTISQSIDITLKNDGAAYASVGTADISIALNIDGVYEYVPIGIFHIDDVTKTDYTVKLTCYDNMILFERDYASSLGDTPTLQQVVDELKSLTGVDYDTTNWTVPNYTVTKLSGYTCREILGMVASICGGNAYITRAGLFTVVVPKEVDCTITADNYIGNGYTVEDSTYKIGMITCQNVDSSSSTSSYDASENTTTISAGSLTSDSMELTFKNIWVTQTILNDIYNKIGGFSYLGYTLKWQGDLSLDAGDIITLVDNKNVTRKAYVYANKLTYSGGLVAETSAKGQTKTSNSFSTTGNNTTNIERISVKLLLAEKAIITKANIVDLEASNARIDNLDASVATINTAIINFASIDQLNATNANIATLNASVANINSALINKANIGDLTATNATVSNLSATVANISTLINGNLTSANIQSLVLTSDKVTVADAFIKDAMIDSINANKISAGSINTSKINVTSADGSLLIAGATQQFKDSNGKVRIQMGQDAQGNFNFILVASDGTTTLIDGTGVKANAIADGLIKTDMIADAAITSNKIDYSSFITGYNADTNTNYIKASKVAVDLDGQTLDVAFNNLSTKVDGISTSTDATTIQAMQGQISTLISNTTITNADNTTTQLKDAYSSLKETINSIDLIIGEHSSYTDAGTGTITSVSSKLSEINANLNNISLNLSSATTTANNASSLASSLQLSLSSITTRVSNTETSISGINDSVSTLTQNQSSITQNVSSLQSSVNSISSRTSTLETNVNGISANVTSITTTVNNIQIGGRNLLLNTSLLTVGYWELVGTVLNLDGTATITSSTTGSYIQKASVFSNIANQIYTVSVKVKTSNLVGKGMSIYVWYDNGWHKLVANSIFNESTDFKLFSATFVPTTANTIGVGFQIDGATGNSGTAIIKEPKIEIGNQATDWSPAPEDTNSQITTINNSISVLQNQISLKVEQSNIDSAVTTINGQIATQNTTISSLQSQININSTSITSLVNQSVSNKNLINNPAFNNPLGDYQATNTITNCAIVNYSAYTGWGYAKNSLSNNALWIRYDMTGDNYVEFKNLFAKVKPNTTYTLSYYYTMNGEYTAPSSFIYERTSAQWGQITYSTPTIIGPDSTNARSTWTRYTKTFTTQSTTDSIMLRFGFHQTHSSGLCELLITAIQLEEGSTATAWVNSATSIVGTSMIQSTTDFMYAFNNISSYFQINSSGATFGNISSGDYTTVGSGGMKHHIGGTDYDYIYISYMMDASISISSYDYTLNGQYATSYDDIDNHLQSYYVPYDSTLKALLNGRTPKSIMIVAATALSYPSKPSDWTQQTSSGGVYYGYITYYYKSFGYGSQAIQNCDANGITIRLLNAMYRELDTFDGYGTVTNKAYSIHTGGTVGVRFFILA
jgi:predicted  nucleic acid-binding Zn-ribbon protein